MRSAMTLAWLICAAPLFTTSAWAADKDDRFIEIPLRGSTEIFDLKTVQIILPDRFVVTSTEIDDPDVMRLELKALQTLWSFCKRPLGKYPVPKEIFVLGSPDMPVKSVEVTKSVVFWYYPYERLSWGTSDQKPLLIDCSKSSYQQLSKVTNGWENKHQFDCKRHMHGISMPDLDEGNPSKINMASFAEGSITEDIYFVLCWRVTGKDPAKTWPGVK